MFDGLRQHCDEVSIDGLESEHQGQYDQDIPAAGEERGSGNDAGRSEFNAGWWRGRQGVFNGGCFGRLHADSET